MGKLLGYSHRTGVKVKSAQPLNEVRVAKALTEYFIKYSQNENANITILTDLSKKMSFEPSKPQRML